MKNKTKLTNGAYKKDTVVLYHAGCNDGFGGAFAAWKKFGTAADYIPVQRQELPPPLSGKTIYTIDFTYPDEQTRQLIKNNVRVTAIDHHVSSEEAIKMTDGYLYDLDHSGAILAWKYFHPGKIPPRLLKSIEDIDLWRFKVPNSKEISAYLDLHDKDFKVWDKIAQDFEKDKSRKSMIKDGSLLIRYEDKMIARIVESNAELVKFLKYKVLAVNSANFNSQIGHLLVQKKPPIGIVWRQKNGKIIISLRSDGSVDVARIAKRLGGGGSRRASAFSVKSFKDLPFKLIN